jgi:hypothetical protein
MVGRGVLGEKAMHLGEQIAAADFLPVAGSSAMVYTVYGCWRGLQD